MGQIRLDKFLANAGIGSRSEVKLLAKKGRITINHQPVKKADCKIDPSMDQVAVDGKPVSYSQYEYYMLNKPAGCVSATRDNFDKTVVDFIDSPRKEELFPVGRLDKDTEGLLLITNDGALAHELLSPRKHVDKTYYARVQGTVTDKTAALFEKGVEIGDEKPTLPAKLTILQSGNQTEVQVTIQEGRFHQVKRMFQAVGCEVLYLKRLTMGQLTLDETLQLGSYRPLTEIELERLRRNLC